MRLMRWRGLFYIVAILFLLPAFRYNEGCDCCDGANYIFGVMEYVPKIDDPPSEKPAIGNPPSYFSWMDYNGDWTTPARYQGACGSCWDFAAVGALESVINIEEGIPDLDPDLSEQYVMSCLPLAGSCKGGSPYGAYKYIKSTSADGNYCNGIVLESCFPYKADDTVPCSDKCSDWEEKLVPIVDYGYWLPDGSDEDRDRIKTMIMEKGPVVTFMMATEEFMQWGLYNHNPEDYYKYPGYVEGINHCVVIVGWKDDASISHGGYWICKNSWGSYWGYNGFFNIEYGSLHIDDFMIVWVEYDANDFDWPPIANAGGPYFGRINESISFDGSRSHDAEGSIISWKWDFGDGSISHEQNPKHAYNERGLYTVTLTVIDESGRQSVDKTAVFIDLWKEKDEWTFNINEIKIDAGFAKFNGNIDSLSLKVTNSNKIDLKGRVKGEFETQLFMNVSGKLLLSRLHGNLYLKPNFEIGNAEIIVRGIALITIESLPIPIPFKIEANVKLKPSLALIDFPLYIGKEWDTVPLNIEMDAVASSLFGIIKIPFQYNTSIGAIKGRCTSKKIINVPAGTYEAYKIEFFDFIELYYAPEVANVIKLSASYEENSVNAELKGTNYE